MTPCHSTVGWTQIPESEINDNSLLAVHPPARTRGRGALRDFSLPIPNCSADAVEFVRRSVEELGNVVERFRNFSGDAGSCSSGRRTPEVTPLDGPQGA